VGELLLVAFLGGFITGISPCIVPVLPVVVSGGSTGTSRARPYLIIAGLVASFSITELLGSTILSALGLPLDFLYWFGIALLLALAVGLMVPKIGEWTERPFNRLGGSRYASSGSGFVLGLSLGPVFVPCAGPVLTAISVAAAHQRVSASTFLVTILYTLGASIPLLFLAVMAQRAATGWQKARAHLAGIRRVAGAVLAVTTLAIAFNLFSPLSAVPGYTNALENHIERSGAVSKQLQTLSGEHANTFAAKQASQAKAPAKAKTTSAPLPDLGPAPNFAGIVSWLNTPGDMPLTLAQLRGKVVLIDFWTYSCINCQRSLPHVEAWYNAYKNDGLVVVGVHTPEFAFEHVVSNVRAAAAALGVDYPVAVDSNYGTWDAYNNQYWPAEYLIDPKGEVRGYDFGEGGYATMESHIRELLTANGVTDLPAPTEVADKTPTSNAITQESYLGYQQLQYAVGTAVVDDQPLDYHAPATIPINNLAFDGTWTNHMEEATAGADAQILLHFTADDVYLVMEGSGTVTVSDNGVALAAVSVDGIPKLYTLLSGSKLQTGVLTLSFSPGVEAYDFTFG
jgi:cytochrome c biogenesis protein CcdA/thiol-disulfide isomerase/thioredoxin